MPLGKVPVVIDIAAGTIVMLTGPVVVCAGFAESVAFTCRFEVPAIVGVPLTRQLAPIVSPRGSVPDVTVQL